MSAMRTAMAAAATAISAAMIMDEAQQEYLVARAADTRILNNHRLMEHRRMRSKVLHYLDNPEFALLILITPYEAPAEASAIDAGAASVE